MKASRIYTAQEMREAADFFMRNSESVRQKVRSNSVLANIHESTAMLLQAAKMREALSRILGIADHLQTRFAIPKFASEEISELKQIAESAISVPTRNCDVLSKDEVLEMLDDRSFSKEDTIEWLYEEAKGEVK